MPLIVVIIFVWDDHVENCVFLCVEKYWHGKPEKKPRSAVKQNLTFWFISKQCVNFIAVTSHLRNFEKEFFVFIEFFLCVVVFLWFWIKI